MMPGCRRSSPLPRHARVVLFGDFLSPLEDIQATIGRLASIPLSGHLLQVLDPAEADLPYTGRICFRGLEREGDTLIPRVEGVRDEYGPPDEGAAGGPGGDLRRRGIWLCHSPHRSFARGRAARPLHRADRAMMAGTSPAVTVEGRAAARNDR